MLRSDMGPADQLSNRAGRTELRDLLAACCRPRREGGRVKRMGKKCEPPHEVVTPLHFSPQEIIFIQHSDRGRVSLGA